MMRPAYNKGKVAKEESSDEEKTRPKTAGMPDPMIYPLSKIEELLDIRSLLPELMDEAWSMLRRHICAFGFDG